MPLHKKGDNKDCNNYRGITLLSTMVKIYERILEKRLKTTTEAQMEDAQSGFRKGRGVQDHIFTMKQLIEKNINNTIYVAFVDIEKAFDSIPRKEIWNSLEQRGISNKLEKAIYSLYRNTRNYVRRGNLQSEEFVTKEGLRQGGVLSPTLFNIVLDDVIKETKSKTRKLQVGYRNMKIVELVECAFADDLMIYGKNEKELQMNLEIWKTALEKRSLRVNVAKTKVMTIGKKEANMEIKLDGKIVEQIEVFKYLGVSIHKDGREEAEINNRIENTTKLFYALNNTFIRRKEISQKTKMAVYNTIYKPILTYGGESWVLNSQMKSRLQTLEMKYLRGVKGISRRDKIRNEAVRSELNVEPILKSIEKQHLKWFGHIVRMEDERQTKRIWLAKSTQKRPKGRPRKTWDQVVAECLKDRGISWREGLKMAENREKWATFVNS